MTEGTLCMVVCPVLEDEMIYNLTNDPEEKRIFLLENDNTRTLLPKLKKNSIDYTVLNERDFIDGKVDVPKEGYNVVIWMMDLGLHTDPKKLKTEIMRELLEMDGRADGMLLYYGLCGQALLGICDWARENMRTPITIFKDKEGRICDDCVCVPLGGPEQYLKLLKRYPGVMYLTPAMACSQDEFMAKNELFQGLEMTDMSPQEYMKFMLDMAGYKYALKIQTNLGDQEHFQEECERYVKKYDLELKELEPEWISTEVADRAYEEAKAFLSQ